MRNNLILLLGIAAIAAPLGFMVGGSATPVVGIALPAIFGLVATAIGLFQTTWPSKEHAELVVLASTNADIRSHLESMKSRLASTPRNIGLALILFSAAYTSSAILGIRARTEDWFSVPQPEAPEFPWASSKKPPTIESALQWIVLQADLRTAGYTDLQISTLYEIQSSQWDVIKNTTTASQKADDKTKSQEANQPSLINPYVLEHNLKDSSLFRRKAPGADPFKYESGSAQSRSR